MAEFKRIMITGTSGFLGSRLFDFFTKNGKYQIKCKNDYEVFAPTHQQLDITNKKNCADLYGRSSSRYCDS